MPSYTISHPRYSTYQEVLTVLSETVKSLEAQRWKMCLDSQLDTRLLPPLLLWDPVSAGGGGVTGYKATSARSYSSVNMRSSSLGDDSI